MSNPLDHEVNEIVDVIIRGVRIARPRTATSVTITDERGVAYQMPPQAVVERVAPADWPPRHKDVWRSGDGELWIAYVEPVTDGSTRIEMHGVYEFFSADTMLAKYSPMQLVHREDETDEQPETSLYADLIGKRVAVRLADEPGVTGVLTDAQPHGIRVRVDHPIRGIPYRDVRAEDIDGVDPLDEQDGAESSKAAEQSAYGLDLARAVREAGGRS